MDCICAELDFLFIAHIPSLTFLLRSGILKSKVVVGTPGCSPSLQNAQKTLSFSLSLRVFRVRFASAKALFRARRELRFLREK
jgi:hypothetical protein